MIILRLKIIALIAIFISSCDESSKYESSPEEEELNVTNEIKDSIRVIELSGNNYEIGLQHGELLKNEIHELVKLWEEDIELNYQMPSNEFITKFLKSTNYIQAIKKWTPNLLEEMKGISKGSGIELNKIIVFQLIDEMWTNGRIVETPHHCTSLGVLNRMKEDSVNYIAQNIDVTPFYHKYKVLLQITKNSDSTKTYVTTFPGYIGANGLNQNIGVSVNSLMDLESSLDGLPVCCVVRGVLCKQNFIEAEQFLRKIKHASGQNYIIGSREDISSFECSASKVSTFWPDSTHLYTFHANNTLSNDSYNPFYLSYLTDSLNTTHKEFIKESPRLEAIENRILGNNSIDLKTIKEALASKDDSVEFVCNQYTWVSTIMEFHDDYNLLLISPGKPDSSDYQEFKIK
jgi:hypothetical protein